MTVKCSVFIATSLDGFIARRDGGIDWLIGSANEENEDYGYGEFISTVDALVMGRNTYELALTFKEWPYEGRRVLVLTSRSPVIPKPLRANVEMTSSAPAEIIRDLSEQGARHVYVDGGNTIQGFLRAGLVHEMTITRIPILIGEGLSLFGDTGRDIKLQHIVTRAYGNGFVQSKYGVVGGAG